MVLPESHPSKAKRSSRGTAAMASAASLISSPEDGYSNIPPCRTASPDSLRCAQFSTGPGRAVPEPLYAAHGFILNRPKCKSRSSNWRTFAGRVTCEFGLPLNCGAEGVTSISAPAALGIAKNGTTVLVV